VKACGCLFSDAWRCADARSLALMTCHCHCHRPADDPIRAAITRAQADMLADAATACNICGRYDGSHDMGCPRA